MPRLPFRLALPTHKHQTLSDKDLMSACLKGDNTAWNTLIDRYAALIFSSCLRSGLSATDAEDVVQDVCVILLDHLADVRDDTKLSSWLISTTKREAWRFQRRKGLKLESELGDGDWSFENSESVHSQMGESPEVAVLALEEQQMVRHGLEKLPNRCRRLLSLLYGTETPPSYTDLAEEFSIPVGSIGPTRARCLQQLRKLLVASGY